MTAECNSSILPWYNAQSYHSSRSHSVCCNTPLMCFLRCLMRQLLYMLHKFYSIILCQNRIFQYIYTLKGSLLLWFYSIAFDYFQFVIQLILQWHLTLWPRSFLSNSSAAGSGPVVNCGIMHLKIRFELAYFSEQRIFT